MDKLAIERALQLLQRVLPAGTSLAVVILMPRDGDGPQEGHVVDCGLDQRAREFAAECLTSGAKVGLDVRVH